MFTMMNTKYLKNYKQSEKRSLRVLAPKNGSTMCKVLFPRPIKLGTDQQRLQLIRRPLLIPSMLAKY